jgi:hypothetical protein
MRFGWRERYESRGSRTVLRGAGVKLPGLLTFRSLIITTNLEFSKWGSIFTDDQLAATMIDRLAHHGYILLFEGESYRMKHALMRQKN